jgi:hypothetical protein
VEVAIVSIPHRKRVSRANDEFTRAVTVRIAETAQPVGFAFVQARKHLIVARFCNGSQILSLVDPFAAGGDKIR